MWTARGHSEQIAKRLTTGRLIAIDRDEMALSRAQERLAPYADRITFVHGNFRDLPQLLADAGVTGAEIDGAARKVIADAGYGDYFGHGYGHSLGILIHEAPNANTRNDQPMPENAVVSAEPGIYLPGKFGVRIEDVTVLTKDGCEILTKSPKNLIIL